jgi:hypothetical protein
MDPAFLDDFRRVINSAADQLLAHSDAAASLAPAPGKWSKKEIVGHLIDSAVHNHARLVRARVHDHVAVDDYDQVRWVEMQRYRDRAWTDLVHLWQVYNVHIAWVMETVAAGALAGSQTSQRLDDLMRDYVAHLKHHLRQAIL